MGLKKRAILWSLMGFCAGLNALDYDTLDPKYYKYIKYYKAYEDKEVEELIRDLKRANAKSGLILGINTGFFTTMKSWSKPIAPVSPGIF